MRFIISFGPVDNLPPEAGTEFVYSCLTASDDDYAKWVHDKGHWVSHKKIKPFAVSMPYTTGSGDCHLKVSSMDARFIRHFSAGLNMLMAEGKAALLPKSVKLRSLPALRYNAEGRTTAHGLMVTPLVVKTGRNEYMTEPADPACESALRENLVSKHEALTGRKPDDSGFSFAFRDWRATSRMYKGKRIPAFFGRFTMTASRDMLKTAFYQGLGIKNSLAFGMIDFNQPHCGAMNK